MGSMRSSMDGVEEGAGGDGVRDAARQEEAGDSLGAAKFVREACGCGGVGGSNYPLLRPSVGGGHGSLLVALAVVDHDAAEVGDCLHQVLEAVVPVGGDLEDEHDALVGEAELEIADLADVVDEILGVVDLL